jgi:hypothetical protein
MWTHSWRVSAVFFAAVTLANGQELSDLQRDVTDLRAMVQKLQARVDELESKIQNVPAQAAGKPGPLVAKTVSNATPAPVSSATVPPASESTAAPEPAPNAAPPSVFQAAPAAAPSSPGEPTEGFPQGTTFNMLFDGYYENNFNSPIGRVNRLRAYDVTSNSFSINQAAVVVEDAADPDHGKHWGARLDLQFGQATETLQGNAGNEPRPDIYRAIFQAYGTVVIPWRHHNMTVDFGKFASSLGIEGNYTKDQINYSRSFWFNYLPFYHMGLRLNYPVNDRLTVHYWLTNGTQQTEAFNGFKDQSAGLVWQAKKNLTWDVNYYLGQEHPDVIFYPYGAPPGLTNLPTQQGVPFHVIPNPATGRLHIFDSYATWQMTPALTLAGEADWVIERLFTWSPPGETMGGAGYFRYQISKNIAAAARAEYLDDRGALFSGAVQSLKEGTLTLEYKFGKDFLMRAEWRRDFSNNPYFYTDALGILSKGQTTAGMGVVWWFGTKQGAW